MQTTRLVITKNTKTVPINKKNCFRSKQIVNPKFEHNIEAYGLLLKYITQESHVFLHLRNASLDLSPIDSLLSR